MVYFISRLQSVPCQFPSVQSWPYSLPPGARNKILIRGPPSWPEGELCCTVKTITPELVDILITPKHQIQGQFTAHWLLSAEWLFADTFTVMFSLRDFYLSCREGAIFPALLVGCFTLSSSMMWIYFHLGKSGLADEIGWSLSCSSIMCSEEEGAWWANTLSGVRRSCRSKTAVSFFFLPMRARMRAFLCTLPSRESLLFSQLGFIHTLSPVVLYQTQYMLMFNSGLFHNAGSRQWRGHTVHPR